MRSSGIIIKKGNDEKKDEEGENETPNTDNKEKTNKWERNGLKKLNVLSKWVKM